jgi:hypothetical protein
MIFDLVGLGRLPQRLNLMALLPAPDRFLERSRRLRTRAGFFKPSLDGGLELLELLKPR